MGILLTTFEIFFLALGFKIGMRILEIGRKIQIMKSQIYGNAVIKYILNKIFDLYNNLLPLFNKNSSKE